MFKTILLFLCFIIKLSAQEAQDTFAYSIDLYDYVITAQYEPTHYKKSMHRVNVIKKDIIAKLGAVTLDQALVLSPAVRIYEDPILGTLIRMRGVSSSNVAVLVDGVPMIGRNDGAIDLSQFAMHNVERIEVVEGPLSNIYGNNAAGGVINIITKKSQVATWDIQQSNQIESIGKQNHTASIAFQKGKWNLGVNGRYFKYEQYDEDSLRLIDEITFDDGSTINRSRYPFNPKVQKSVSGFLRYSMNEDHVLIGNFSCNNEDVSDYGVVKRIQFNPYAEDVFYKTKRRDYSLNYTGKLGQHTFVKLLSSYNVYDRVLEKKRYYLETMKFDSLLQTSEPILFEQLFSRANLHYTGLNHWTIGGGYTFTKETGEGERLLNPKKQDSLLTSFNESAFYTDIKYSGIKDFQVAMSNRFIKHSTYNNAFTSAFHLKYDVSEKVSVRASFAEGYRSPTLKELYLEFIDFNHYIIGNPDLQPEESIDWQSTIVYSPTKDFQFGLNAYYTLINDRISLIQYETLKYKYDNVDNYDVFGFQPSIQFTKDRVEVKSSLSIGYWASNVELDDAPKYGQVLDMNNQFRYSSRFTGVNLLLNHRFVGSQPIYQIVKEELQIGSISSYNILDLSLSRSFWNDRISLNGGIRNVLDTQIAEVSNTNSGIHSVSGQNQVSIGRSYFIDFDFSFE